LPTRLDQYKAGPFEVSFTKTATKQMGSKKNKAARTARTKSKSLFI